jgi:hypothetical protein
MKFRSQNLVRPVVKYDYENDRLVVVARQHGVEKITDISDQLIAFHVPTLKRGWVAYPVRVGRTIQGLTPVTQPEPAAPSEPAGLTKQGLPAPWWGYACVDVLIEGSNVLHTFEMEDSLTSEMVIGICDGRTGIIKARFAGSETITDHQGNTGRLPMFDVLS